MPSEPFDCPPDQRLKTNIRPIENARATAVAIRGVLFDWGTTDKEAAGLLEREVQKVFPPGVRDMGNGRLRFEPMALIGLLFAALGDSR